VHVPAAAHNPKLSPALQKSGLRSAQNFSCQAEMHSLRLKARQALSSAALLRPLGSRLHLWGASVREFQPGWYPELLARTNKSYPARRRNAEYVQNSKDRLDE